MKPITAVHGNIPPSPQSHGTGRSHGPLLLVGLTLTLAGLCACESLPPEVEEVATPAPSVPETPASAASEASAAEADELGVFDLAAREEIQPTNATTEADKLERELMQELTRLGVKLSEDLDGSASPSPP